MSREWAPGDVALVKTAIGSTVMCTWTGDDCQPAARYSEHPKVPHWHTSAGRYLTAHDGGRERTARPLVVIDPEDREQVERIIRAWLADDDDAPTAHGIDVMQDALREFANPTPSEPTDPKARVTDRRENIWRLLADGDWVCTSGPDMGEYLVWWQLAQRGPLSIDGVTP